IIKVDNNSIINFASAWAQLVYNTDRINTYISATSNNNWYKRVDRFNYIDNTDSEVVYKPGFDLRAGFLWNANEFQNIYINGSYISRAPYFKYVFGNYTNVVVKDLKNETARSLEIGYRLNWKNTHLNLSAYVTNRDNVSMLSNEYVQLENKDQTRAMVNGLKSINKGIEIEFKMDVNRNLKFGGWASIGDFSWQNNVNASLFNDNNVAVDTVNVFAEGLYIGGTAQNQAGLFAELVILKTLYLTTEFQYFDKLYADFDPTSRSNPSDLSQPFQLPAYGIINAYLSFPFSIDSYHGRLQINAYNILDKKYIVLGEDGVDHNLETFRGFWSFGRNLTFSLKFNF
ncbi:MAG: TonB-dependent receptor, partial [Bacteroidetes bacterium]|nr:TonB-dependent receptor [Bacteroidota bacterium]